METIHFIDITFNVAAVLFVVGFIGGMVSGFIGSGGAFVLTPAMMSLGVPATVAVASNMAHKFPKALVGSYKRHKYGQVDIKLGLVLGVFAESGVLFGKHVMVAIRKAFGAAGTNLYVSFVFLLVLGIVGGFVLRDGLRELHGENIDKQPSELNVIARWIRGLHVPGTMIYFKSIDASISFLLLAPMGFATGLLAASIAVGGFIGVPALIYLIGLPALMASATELVIAFVMGMGGSFFYALDGFVDIRLSMIILAGSLFGIQVGAIGTTYVKDHVVKLVMAGIMLLVLVSRFFYIPGYLFELGVLPSIGESSVTILNTLGQAALSFALGFGAIAILFYLYKGIREYRLSLEMAPAAVTAPYPAEERPTPLGHFERILVASDRSEFSVPAVREAMRMAQKCGSELHLVTVVLTNVVHEGMGENILKHEMEDAQSRLDELKQQMSNAGLRCVTHVCFGTHVADRVIELAKETKANLIVVGRRGKRGLARIMLGHATARIIGDAPCSVLVVPRTAHLDTRHIVLATDGSETAGVAAAVARQLAKYCKIPVTAVSVITPEHDPEHAAAADAVIQKVTSFMKEEEVTVDGMVRKGLTHDVVAHIVDEKNADIIVIGSHGLTGPELSLLGSTAERILNKTSSAVLVARK